MGSSMGQLDGFHQLITNSKGFEMASHSTGVTTIQLTTRWYCFLESLRLDHDLQTHSQWTRIL